MKHPNILYIFADDMGYGDVACLNPESKIPTPNLDRLAAQGTRFTDAHAASAVCTPSRYGVLTGRYCWRSRLQQGVLGLFDPPLIEPGRLTVPELLRRHGYATAAVGKWHLGIDWPTTDGKPVCGKPGSEDAGPMAANVDFARPIRNGPTDVGFDFYFGHDSAEAFIENDRVLGAPRPQEDGPPQVDGWRWEDVLPRLEERAVAYIEEHAKKASEKPFFMYFAPMVPHTPIVPIERFHGTSAAGRYGDFVHQFDATIGQLLDALDRTGLADDTLVVFTSDNGAPGYDGEGGGLYSALRFGHNSSHVFRGIKADAWEGGHHVPFIARWPGRIPAGAENDEIIDLADFMGTCAAIVGAELPDDAGEDSYNVLPALEGRRGDAPIRETTIHASMFLVFCVRQGRWKLIQGHGSGGWSDPKYGAQPGPDDPPGQLYDMEADVSEQRNLYNERPDIVRQLTERLETIQRQGHSRPMAGD